MHETGVQVLQGEGPVLVDFRPIGLNGNIFRTEMYSTRA